MLDQWKALAPYRDRRVASLLFFGFSSGLPRGLVGTTLAAWLTDAGVSMTEVGFLGAVATVYSLKFLWAPIMDHVPVPLFSRLLGRRRGWMLVSQAALAGALLALGSGDPAANLWMTGLLALGVAFFSASQDVVVDAYRVEILKQEQFGAGAAMYIFGYNFATLATGFGALYMAQYLSWDWVYPVAAVLTTVGAAAVLVNPEPPAPAARPAGGPAAWLRVAAIDPFADMVRRNGWQLLAIVAFVLLYKLGDAFAGAAATPFYLKAGFTKVDVANASKVFGVIATIFGTFVGGALVAKMGIMRALLLCGVLQMGSNLAFAYLAMVGKDMAVLYAAIAIENVSGGMGGAAFVAYLSGLTSLTYTGTQYALLSSLGTLTRNSVAATWGWMVDGIGWAPFFLLTTVAALPGLLVLMWMMRRYPVATPAPAPAPEPVA